MLLDILPNPLSLEPTMGQWLIAVGIGGLFLVIALLLFVRGSSRVLPEGALPKGGGEQLNRIVAQLPLVGNLFYLTWEERLRLANAPFRPAELYLLSLGTGTIVFLLFESLLGYALLSLVVAAVAAMAPFVLVQHRAQQNRQLLTFYIGQACLSLASAAVETGASQVQLIILASEELPPLGPLFIEVLAERDRGLGAVGALKNLRERIKHHHLESFIDILLIHFENGARVSERMQELAEEIEIESELTTEIQTRLAQPRYQFWFVCLLSLPVLLYLRLEDPSAVNAAFGTLVGQLFIVGLWGVALFLYLFVRQITKFENL